MAVVSENFSWLHCKVSTKLTMPCINLNVIHLPQSAWQSETYEKCTPDYYEILSVIEIPLPWLFRLIESDLPITRVNT